VRRYARLTARYELCDHQPEWDENASATIQTLKAIFGDAAADIQHVGSTAIRWIKAKPIIDIAVGVQSFDVLPEVAPRLEANGLYKSARHAVPGDVLYAIRDSKTDTRTHHIHIVVYGSDEWQGYINLRDYLNVCPGKAHAYERVKMEMAKKYPSDWNAYVNGKAAFITQCLAQAKAFAQARDKANRFE